MSSRHLALLVSEWQGTSQSGSSEEREPSHSDQLSAQCEGCSSLLSPVSCSCWPRAAQTPPAPPSSPVSRKPSNSTTGLYFSLFKIFQIILTKIFRLDGFSQKEFCPEVLDLYSKLDSESDSLKRQSIIADLKSKVRLGVSYLQMVQL